MSPSEPLGIDGTIHKFESFPVQVSDSFPALLDLSKWFLFLIYKCIGTTLRALLPNLLSLYPPRLEAKKKDEKEMAFRFCEIKKASEKTDT